MGQAIEFDVIKVDHYNSLQMQIYDGKVGLMAIQNGENGNHYKVWCFLSKWSKAAGGPVADEKKRPMAVRIGETRPEAVKVLRELLAQLEGRGQAEPAGDDQIPF